MTSFAFNPVTVTIGAISLIIIVTALLPMDVWDRFSDWIWRSDSDGSTPPQVMPWENKER